MEKQNVTLALPKDVLRAARHLAVERGTSLSALLAEYLARVVRENEAYAQAMRRARARLAVGKDLGTMGRVAVSRAQLYER